MSTNLNQIQRGVRKEPSLFVKVKKFHIPKNPYKSLIILTIFFSVFLRLRRSQNLLKLKPHETLHKLFLIQYACEHVRNLRENMT